MIRQLYAGLDSHIGGVCFSPPRRAAGGGRAENAQTADNETACSTTPLRDTCVCVGPDKTYYLTGTTGDTKPGGRRTTAFAFGNRKI